MTGWEFRRPPTLPDAGELFPFDNMSKRSMGCIRSASFLVRPIPRASACLSARLRLSAALRPRSACDDRDRFRFLRDRQALQRPLPVAAPAALTCNCPALLQNAIRQQAVRRLRLTLPRTKNRTGSRPASRKSAPITASMVFESTVLLRRRPLLSSPRLRRKCLPSQFPPLLLPLLAADQPGTNSRQLTFAPLGMQREQRLATTRPRTASPRYSRRSLSAGADFLLRPPAQAGVPESGA